MSAGLAAKSGVKLVLLDDDEAVPGALSQDALIARSAPARDVSGSGDDMVGIFYTGGTTGWPKGVMLSHGNLVANAVNTLTMTSFDTNTVILHAAPMFHLVDAFAMFSVTAVGGRHVVMRSFEAGNVLATIQRLGVLHAQGILTDAEFNSKKAELLKRL
jgi:long-chain acyl-CoA synthetase